MQYTDYTVLDMVETEIYFLVLGNILLLLANNVVKPSCDRRLPPPIMRLCVNPPPPISHGGAIKIFFR